MTGSTLVIKLGAIGDVVMASPMATALKRTHPEMQVTWLCGHGVAPLLRLLPDIDEIVELDERALLAGTTAQRARAMAGAAAALRRRRFDLVLNGHPDPRYRVLETLVRGGTVRRFTRNPRKRVLPVPGRYHGDEYVRLATGVDGPEASPADLPRIRPPLPAAIEIEPTASYIAVAPGGAHNVLRDNEVRRWPLERYAKLAAELDERGHEVVICGGPSDRWVQDAFGHLPGRLDLVGRTSLPDLLAVFGACDAVVTHDSGPMHLARLAGSRLVALFGPTDPSWFLPSRPARTTVLRGGEALPCRPCYDGRQFTECRSAPCMADIPVDEVLRALRPLLDADEGRSA